MEFIAKDFSIHDKYQMETIFTYSLNADQAEKAYQVDTYFFVPDNLGIHQDSYSREKFFGDLQRYIRLKTPAMRFDAIFKGEHSPLKKLEHAMVRLSEETGLDVRQSYADRMKMFCSIMKSAVRDETQFLTKSRQDDNFNDLFERTYEEVTELLEQFRKLKKHLQTPVVADDDRTFFCHADEFISLTVEKYFGRLWKAIDSSGEAGTGSIKDQLFDRVVSEIAYRKKNGYPSQPEPEGGNGELLYRKSTLKKVMASVLFLRSSRRRNGVFLENLLLGAAAGIAMTFATGVAFAWKGLFLEEFSMTFFVIWVIAYMGKDRIKELLRYYFQAHLRNQIFDYKTEIFTGLGHRIGFCKESMHFVTKKKLDPEVLRLRGRSYLSGLENEGYQEQVILYRKLVELHPEPDEKIFRDFKVNGLVDIMRFNVSSLLSKMDNPNQEVLVPATGEKTLNVQKAKRLYHVNILVRFGQKDRPPTYRRFRMILSRNGIQRIETVALPQD